MFPTNKWVGAIAISTAFSSIAASSSVAMEMHRFGDLRIAQSNDPNTKGKSDPNTGRPSNQTDPKPLSGGQAPSPTMQNAPQSGVPARCANLTNAAERQKCMDTPKGQ
jgi:hypothetical protein